MNEPMNEAEARKRSTLALESIAGSLLRIIEMTTFAIRGIYEGMKKEK